MKQIQLDQFDPARLLTYLLSRLIESHAVDQAPSKSISDRTGIDQDQSSCAPRRTVEQILETAERRWPSRYY
jgi:hypothetical protein